LTLDNYGDIAALYSTELVLNTAANAITNEAGATLEAKSGGILEIDSNVTNLNATTSKIVADDGGTVELVSDTITGGTLQLASSGNATTLQIEGTVTLSATTTTTLSNSANNFIVSTNNETAACRSTLNNRGNLSGAGTIGDANLTLDNYGDIAALYSTELVLNTAANAITNDAGATLEAKSGGILEIDSNVTNLNATTSKIVADDGGTVELVSDTITGGTLQLASSGNATTLQIEGTVTLSATTTTTLSNSANNFIVSTSDETGGAASTLINRGNLSGAGTIGDANLTLDNYGDIAALYSTELVLNAAANAITNEAGATLEAKSGGILEIDSNVTNLNATTSKIVADDGGTVELVSDTITGGTLQLASSGNATTLQIEGTVTLSATTTTTLSNSANNFIVSTSDETGGAASTLINRGNLSGAGTIGDANLTLDNYGDIAALYSTELVLNTAANAITNEAGATLEAKSGGILEIDSNVTNLNATTSKIVADDGGTVELVSDTITGGTLQLASSGNATTLQIEGTVTLSATTTTTLSNSANNFIVSTSDETGGAASTLINRGNLSGAGTIGDANLTLDNYGDIAALYSTELVLNAAANAITNEAGATLEAKSGGILEIDSNVTNLNATTSKIVADDGGTVELVSDTITGGTLQLASSGNATTLQIEGTVTLSATTTTTLSNSANNFIVSTSDETGGAASTLINRGNLSGAGTIGDANLTLDNYGDIAALYSTELVLNTAANAITNEAGATLEAKSGGILEIDSNVT